MSSLKGRVALVTGGSRGVGRAVAERLAEDGAAVAICYRRDEEAADEAVAAIRAKGGVASAHRATIGDDETVGPMVEQVRAIHGAIDILVSNAGAASRGDTIAETDPAEYVRLMNVHTWGPISLIRSLLPQMREAERSDIVVVSSVTTDHAPANSAPYTMAKSAMETAARTLAWEERAHGIHVNIVAPGLVATDMGSRLARATIGTEIADLDASYPFGRVCRPEDVAGVVGYLVSADAGYLSGQRLVVNGGGPAPALV